MKTEKIKPAGNIRPGQEESLTGPGSAAKTAGNFGLLLPEHCSQLLPL